MAEKPFAELNLSDAFLFAAALEDADTCRLVLQLILGKRTSPVRVHAEHSILYKPDLRSIRLDIFAADKERNSYNLEMENWDKGQSLVKRSRFYQAEMDAAALKPGRKFKELRPSYVIFICTFDPFGRGLYRYTFTAGCQEKRFALSDGAVRIFLNTRGKNPQGVSKSLVNFLKYVEDSSDTCVECIHDPLISRLHEKISTLKNSKRWEERYMTVGDLIRYRESAAEKRGERRGKGKGAQSERKRMMQLIARMNQNGEGTRILQLQEDEKLLEKLYQEYQL